MLELGLLVSLAALSYVGMPDLLGNADALAGSSPQGRFEAVESALARFGPDALSKTPCQPGSKVGSLAMPMVSSFQAQWFGAQMAAAEEAPLYPPPPESSHRTSYRFSWIPSFHASIFVRLDQEAAGAMHLTAKRLTGKGGYEPGTVADRLARVLTAEEQARIEALLAQVQPMKIDTPECALGLDGSEWLFEGAEKGRYRMVVRWSPKNGPIRELGDAFLDLTGWNTGTRY